MKLISESRFLFTTLYLLLLLERGSSVPRKMSAPDCFTESDASNCESGNHLQVFKTNNLLSLIAVGLLIIPMLFCCFKAKQSSSSKTEDRQKQDEPPHIYEDIDGEITVPQSKQSLPTTKKSTRTEKQDETQPPLLPDREYLTDIDFVAQEFDLILRRPPDLPQRSASFSNSSPKENSLADSAITNQLKQQFTSTKYDEKSSNSQYKGTQLRQVIKTARPNQYNLTGPTKPGNSLSSQNVFQKAAQNHEEMPVVVLNEPPAVAPSANKKNIANIMTFSNTHSVSRGHVVNAPNVISSCPQTRKFLPSRQAPDTVQVMSQTEGDQRLAKQCRTYQNINELNPTQPSQHDDTYVDVTDETSYYDNEFRVLPARGPQPTEGAYQPLLFGLQGDEDEYIDIETF